MSKWAPLSQFLGAEASSLRWMSSVLWFSSASSRTLSSRLLTALNICLCADFYSFPHNCLHSPSTHSLHTSISISFLFLVWITCIYFEILHCTLVFFRDLDQVGSFCTTASVGVSVSVTWWLLEERHGNCTHFVFRHTRPCSCSTCPNCLLACHCTMWIRPQFLWISPQFKGVGVLCSMNTNQSHHQHIPLHEKHSLLMLNPAPVLPPLCSSVRTTPVMFSGLCLWLPSRGCGWQHKSDTQQSQRTQLLAKHFVEW